MKEWWTSSGRRLRSEDTGTFGWRWVDSPYLLTVETTYPFARANHIHFVGGQANIWRLGYRSGAAIGPPARAPGVNGGVGAAPAPEAPVGTARVTASC